MELKAALVIIAVFAVPGGLLYWFGEDGIGPLAAALGVILVYAGGYGWHQERREVSAFEPTEGRIRTAEVRGRGRKSVRVEYEYTVDGRTYVNDKLWPGAPMKRTQRGDWADRFVEGYPEGSRVEVHYDPDDPSASFLEEKRHRLVWTGLVLMGLVALSYGVVRTALLLAPV